MTAMKIKSVLGFVFKLRALGARLSQPQQIENPRTLRHFVRSFGNPGCCGWDTRAPFHLHAESYCSRSCPHNDATPTRRLIKRWAIGVKNVLRNDLPKKTLPTGAPKRLISQPLMARIRFFAGFIRVLPPVL